MILWLGGTRTKEPHYNKSKKVLCGGGWGGSVSFSWSRIRHGYQAVSFLNQSGPGSGVLGSAGQLGEQGRAEEFLSLDLFCSLWRAKPGAFLQPWKRRRRPVRWGL